MSHHHIFRQFDVFEGWAEAGFERWHYGVNVRDLLFTGTSKHFRDRRLVRIEHPPVDEEYFEWISLLAAVDAATERFCIAEIGAGWGRWIAAAAMLCRQLRMPSQLIGIEAEASHFYWMRMVLRDNDIDPEDHQIIRAAVSDMEGEVLLIGADSPATNYGNRMIHCEGLPTYERWNAHIPGFGSRSVPGMTLTSVLAGSDLVDLMDMDVQGAECDVIIPAFDVLDEKVKLIHVGTHSAEIEQGLIHAFHARGWLNAFAFPGQRIVDTPYGRVKFDDGVQTWVNPKWPALLATIREER